MKSLGAAVWRNIQHLPSTGLGVLTGAVGLILANSDTIQQVGGSSPQLAKWVTGIVGIATGLGLILGVGGKPAK